MGVSSRAYSEVRELLEVMVREIEDNHPEHNANQCSPHGIPTKKNRHRFHQGCTTSPSISELYPTPQRGFSQSIERYDGIADGDLSAYSLRGIALPYDIPPLRDPLDHTQYTALPSPPKAVLHP